MLTKEESKNPILYCSNCGLIKYHMDNFLRSNLTHIKDAVKQDFDFVFVVDGMEGSGKSVLAQQCAYFCDNTFNINRICFTPDQFKKAILAAEKYQAVIFDEAFGGLSAREALGMVNRSLIAMMAEIRQKNLFVFIVLPTFFDLDKNIALWRSRILIHVELEKGYKRGLYYFYTAKRKLKLYLDGKKFYKYNKKLANFPGRFVNCYTVNEEEYKRMKLENLGIVKESRIQEKFKNQRDGLILALVDNFGCKTKELVNLINVYSRYKIKIRQIQQILADNRRETQVIEDITQRKRVDKSLLSDNNNKK
jgi:hypothetical protein